MLTLDLPLSAGRPSTSSGISGGGSTGSSGFNISIRDTEANILATTPTNPSGQVTIAFGTDTYELYVWDGSAWSIYNND